MWRLGREDRGRNSFLNMLDLRCLLDIPHKSEAHEVRKLDINSWESIV